ncbi:MAG TPA: hypothetical protein VFT34_03440 [Verrucomicrobiae bacterium]|nr:hypothetical protein [Verrucomicrobiae bacterium]
MKARPLLTHARIGLLFLLGCVSQLRGDITVRLSVKFILQPDGTRPTAGDIGTIAGFDAELTRGNAILAATGRGYRLQADYPGNNQGDIRPPVPAGESSDYWYSLNARSNRVTIEAAALASPIVWLWSPNAINIYVNNSGSGQCSFVGSGLSISLGNDIGLGTVLHEVGHFFNLSHTHAGDPTCSGPPYLVADGDGLPVTIPDHNCLVDRDSLSMSNFQGRAYSALNPSEQVQVNSSWLNVMSYHREDQLLGDQMDIWTVNANGARLGFCSGRTWFVAIGGSDEATGATAESPFATILRALASVAHPDDVVLLRTGTFTAPPGNTINTACSLGAAHGPVTIGR